jgi:flagellar export protein FliJ
MNAFRFPLQKVLDYRRTQLELEELRFRQQSAAMGDLDRASAQLSASGNTAERQVRAWNPVAGGELAALGSFRLHVKLKETELAVTRTECQKELGRRESVMLEARRRLRLLERLRERRLAEWCSARDKELEDLASEAYLAKWKRRT